MIILPDWPLPANIHAVISTRDGGVSLGSYAGLNLATHVDDDPGAVAENRMLFAREVGKRLSHSPYFDWLHQTHSSRCIRLGDDSDDDRNADASYTSCANRACVVMTADCLPILVSSEDGSEVAAIHAGWRGLANGVVQSALSQFSCSIDTLTCYIGPAISQKQFQVGLDVVKEFEQTFAHHGLGDAYRVAFADDPTSPDRFFADIVELARIILAHSGVRRIYGGEYCTYLDEQFYSYRRDGVTGRFASAVWIANDTNT
jgi:YfiH family protein